MSNILDDIIIITEGFQKECREMIGIICKEKKDIKLDYQSLFNTYIFKKLAEFELRLQKIEQKK